MGQAWCKEKSSKAQDSKSPLDRVFLRCAHTIYPGLKEEGSVLGGATQRVTSSEIGYAGSPPRGALTRGRSIDSVDRPFHPSEWVDVNLEVPGTPRTSALTNLTTHAKLYSASTTAISTGSNKGKNEVPVPPPRQKRKKVTPAGRPLPPKPDDEFHRFRENIINNNNNNNIQHGGNRGNNNNNRNVNNKATSDCNIKDEDFKSLESSNEEDPLYSSVKSLKSNPGGGGDDVENVVSDDIGDNDNDNEGDDDDNDDEGVAGDERVARTKGRIIRSNSIGSSLESKSRCCSSGTKVNANEDVKASTCTSESTAATPVTAVAAATVATTTGACTADTAVAAVAATTTDSTMTTTLTSTKDVYEHKINGTGKIIPSELVSLRTRRNSDREYEKFCRSHSAEESSTPKKESADKSNLNNCNSPNYVDLDEILKTKNSARRLTAEMKAKSSLDSKKDEKVEEKEKDFSNSEILRDENFSEDGKFEERDIGDKREVEGKKECDSFFLHQPKIVSEMMKPEGEFEASSFDDQDFPDTPISRISRTISEESLPREMLLEEVEEEPVAEKKSDLKIEKPRNRRNPFLDENEEKNDSPISEEKIEAQILENDHSVLLKVLKSEGQNEDNCNPSNLSSMTPSLHEFEADLSDLLEKEEKCNDVPGLGNEKYELEDSLDKLFEPKIVKGSGSTRSNFKISEISKITDEVDGKSGHEGISGNEGEKRKNIENAAFEDVDLTENSNSEEKVSKFQVDSGERLLPSEEFHRIGNSHFFVDNKDEEKRKINLNSKKEEEEKKAKEEAFTEETIPPEKPNRLHRYNIAEIVPTPPKRKNRSFPKMHCETEENKKDSNPFENDRLI